MELSECRERLDVIDKKILRLFEERIELAKNVAEYKMEHNRPVLDIKREEKKLEAISAMCEEPEYEQSARELFNQLMSMSRKLQYKMLAGRQTDDGIEYIDNFLIDENTRIAFFGVEGSYAQQAMLRYFKGNYKTVSCVTFEDVMLKVKEGEADFGVLPIENTSTGAITGIHPLLFKYDNFIVDETDLPIEHALLGVEGTKLEDITDVFSHQQGILQCNDFLQEHPGIKTHVYDSTAAAARKVKEEKDIHKAAIASVHTARVYGLDVLASRINYNSRNTTRFIIVSAQKLYKRGADRISLCFEIAHKSGSLYRILSHFIYNNINMTKIESCPIIGRSWEYRFFVDIEGTMSDAAVKNALMGIREETTNLRLLGTYSIT